MKKIVMFLVAIILATTTMPVMAKEEEEVLFETDFSVWKEGAISVYAQPIREFKDGEWSDCDCMGLCFCTQLYHVLEDTTEDNFYSAFFNGDYVVHPLGTVYEDCSSSMEITFAYEKANIIKNLSQFLEESEIEVEHVFKNQKTYLYELLNSFEKKTAGIRTVTMPKETPIIITDLWDTAENQKENFWYDGEIVFCVPYASTNKDGVVHCEDIVNKFLWNDNWIPGCKFIYIVYTDEVVVEYSNGFHNGEEGYTTIYVP